MKQTRKQKAEMAAKTARLFMSVEKPKDSARELFLRKPYSNDNIK